MREAIHPHVRNARSLSEVESGLLHVLTTARDTSPERRVGVVPGIVSSLGDDKIPFHLERLLRYAEWVQKRHDIPVFTTPHVFDAQLYAQLQECALEREVREVHFRQFWRAINGSGLVTDFFMTPRWELSVGAIDEHTTAQEKGMRIHYLPTVPEFEDYEGYVRRIEAQRNAHALAV